ncbi:FAD-dependent monooxygenase [Streptomyces pharetrae]|uniref:FAD-dependent monooxygenase n=1 Tax=Streptomyces pharetrae TaxID=291370 RepID=UPI00345FDBE4
MARAGRGRGRCPSGVLPGSAGLLRRGPGSSARCGRRRAGGRPCTGVRCRVGHRGCRCRVGHGVPCTAPDREPEPILRCPQAELERHFERRARAAGARVLRGYRVSEIVEGDGGVRVEAVGPRGVPAVCLVRYVVGADGARSTVRARARIPC